MTGALRDQLLLLGTPTAALRGRKGKEERNAAAMQTLGERMKTNRALIQGNMSKDMEEVISEGTRRSHRNGRLDLNGDGNRNRLCIISGKKYSCRA